MHFQQSGFVPVGGLGQNDGLCSPLVQPPGFWLLGAGNAYFNCTRMGEVDHVGLELQGLLVGQIPVFNAQMRRALLRANQAGAGGRMREKTRPAVAHAEQLLHFLLATVAHAFASGLQR